MLAIGIEPPVIATAPADVANVTKRFYRDCAEEFERLRNRITGLSGQEQKTFAQTLLTRLMFLRFIERKGWLIAPGESQSHDYLRLLFEQRGYGGKSFYAGRLRALFFEGLAVRGRQESQAIGKVTFLNSGLFEQSKLDEKASDIPDNAFDPLLGPQGLFYRYNFTVREGTESGVEDAVDPEMLGKVFEELVTARQESGAYYTPRPVVSFMCREALKGYLADAVKLDAGVIANLVDRHETPFAATEAKQIIAALGQLRAVDPACGSGAYLLGLLHEMLGLYKCIYNDTLRQDIPTDYELKLRIISQSIHGVDVDPFATQIATLRLWLSLLAESETALPLPNLDFRIRTGDALTGPDPASMGKSFRQSLAEQTAALIRRKEEFLRCHDEGKSAKRAEIIRDENLLASASHASAGDAIINWRVHFCEVFAGSEMPGSHAQSRASDFAGSAPRTVFSGVQPTVRSADCARIAHDYLVLRKVPNVGQARPASTSNGEQCPPCREHLRPGGFDIVLANPPYLNSRHMARSNPRLREQIKASYSMTRGSWDLYIAFFERGFKLLSDRGILAFLTPDKWISKPFGEELRTRTRDRLLSMLRLGRGVFDAANVDAIVSIFTTIPQPSLHLYDADGATIVKRGSVAKEKLQPPYAYDWLFSNHMELLTRLEAQPERFGALAACENACATDDAYRLRDFIREQDAQCMRDSDLRVINTGTIGKYQSRWGRRRMVYLGNEYLRPVINREAFLSRFPNSYGKKAVRPKVIIKGLNLLDACLDAKGSMVPGIPTLLIASEDPDKLKILLAIINHPIAIFYIRQKYPSSSYNGGTTFTKQMVDSIPMPHISGNDRRTVIGMVEELLCEHGNGEAARAAELERELNAHIFRLYQLSPQEAELVSS
jgi:hypothetical protein